MRVSTAIVTLTSVILCLKDPIERNKYVSRKIPPLYVSRIFASFCQ